MELFFHPEIYEDTSVVRFDATERHHLTKVFRKKEGDPVVVTNGKGLEWKGVLSSIQRNHVEAKKEECIQHEVPKNQLHIAIAPPKNNTRLEWFLEKSIEIGIDSIHLICCQRSERKRVNLERLHKIMISAIKQSKQFYLPQLHPIVSFNAFMETLPKPAFIAHCQDQSKRHLSQFSFTEPHTTVLIGPEGDFTPEEINTATEKGVSAVSLGNTILRTETAGLAACLTVRLGQYRILLENN